MWVVQRERETERTHESTLYNKMGDDFQTTKKEKSPFFFLKQKTLNSTPYMYIKNVRKKIQKSEE